MERLPLWEICEGNLEGGLLLLEALNDMYSKALVKKVFLRRVLNGECRREALREK
jgi:hypothetical protein